MEAGMSMPLVTQVFFALLVGIGLWLLGQGGLGLILARSARGQANARMRTGLGQRREQIGAGQRITGPAPGSKATLAGVDRSWAVAVCAAGPRQHRGSAAPLRLALHLRRRLLRKQNRALRRVFLCHCTVCSGNRSTFDLSHRPERWFRCIRFVPTRFGLERDTEGAARSHSSAKWPGQSTGWRW